MRKEVFYLSETHMANGHKINYATRNNKLVITEGEQEIPDSFGKYVYMKLSSTLKDVFLPYGYPNSVSEDYLDYQIWDTVQAFCSTMTGTITTKAIMQSVGVGNTLATPLSAAITWLMKDGIAMVGKIVFAWAQGTKLDSHCKQWRIFADVLNDIAMFFELSLPVYSHITIYVLCITTSLKAIVGVAGGATRASISQHQALRENMADVSAKDGSQETCVNLVATILGVIILALFPDYNVLQFFIFASFSCMHILANYMAIRTLVITHVNETRLLMLLKTYLTYDTVASPAVINAKEPLFMPHLPKVRSICGFDIKLGTSLKELIKRTTVKEFDALFKAHSGLHYIVMPELRNRTMYVSLFEMDEPTDIIAAYFHAVLLGIVLCHYNRVELNIRTKRQLHHPTPLQRLEHFMRTFSSRHRDSDQPEVLEPVLLPIAKLIEFHELVDTEALNFFTALHVNGWDLNKHSLNEGPWRMVKNEQFKGKKKNV